MLIAQYCPCHKSYCRYKRIQNEFTGTLTGKAIEWGGSNIRPEATGYGAVYFGLEILTDMDDTIQVRGSSCHASTTGLATHVAEFCITHVDCAHHVTRTCSSCLEHGNNIAHVVSCCVSRQLKVPMTTVSCAQVPTLVSVCRESAVWYLAVAMLPSMPPKSSLSWVQLCSP